jgi:hypothetical protein
MKGARMQSAWRYRIGAAVLPAVLAGCGDFGKVNQGQVIDYERQQGIVRIIQDSNYRDPANPRYDILPPIEVRVPENPSEMGPAPEAGKLLRLDYQNWKAVIYDVRTGTLRTLSFAAPVMPAGMSPADARQRYPVVDRGARTVAVYDPQAHRVVSLSVPDEYLALPADTWKAGDQVRYYYKDPARALRLMNVSKTDVTKSAK